MERSNLDFDDLSAFFLVAESGSFARAAEKLGFSKSILSRRVARLEAHTGSQLLLRSSSGAQLTVAGEVYYRLAGDANKLLDFAAEASREALPKVYGKLRIAVSTLVNADTFISTVFKFLDQFETLNITIDIIEKNDSSTYDQFDLAILVDPILDSPSSTLPLGNLQRISIASRSYLEAHPVLTVPSDLSRHRILHLEGYNQEAWPCIFKGDLLVTQVQPNVRTRDACLLMSAVKAGQGIALVPSLLAAEAIEAGWAKKTLSDINWGSSELNLILPKGNATAPHFRNLAEDLKKAILSELSTMAGS